MSSRATVLLQRGHHRRIDFTVLDIAVFNFFGVFKDSTVLSAGRSVKFGDMSGDLTNKKMNLKKLKSKVVSQLASPKSEYRRLMKESSRSDSSDSLGMATPTTPTMTVDTRKNEASHDDVTMFWRNAVHPLFRNRRGGVDEYKLMEDFDTVHSMIFRSILEETNLM